MTEFRALKDKVIGKMIDRFGEQVSAGGVIYQEKDGTSEAIRPRWFEVTHVGPEQVDVKVGQYVLVDQGRWTRGIDFYHTMRKEDFVYRLDTDALLVISDDNPLA